MKKQGMKLEKYQRPGRSPRWRVRGTIAGRRISKLFDDYAEASAYRTVKETERINHGRRGATITRLDAIQANDAEHALQLLDGRATLTEAVQKFLASYVAPEKVKTAGEAFELYDEQREKETQRGLLSLPQYRSTRHRVRRFVLWFGSEKEVGLVDREALQGYLDDTFTSPKNYENMRGAVSHFLKWAFRESYLNEDPTPRVQSLGRRIKKSRGVAKTLSPDQVQKLFAFLENEHPEMIPAFALMTFAGIRPDGKSGEIRKLSPDEVNLDAGVITILPDVSKVRELRKIPISPNLREWLLRYPLEKFPIIGHNFGRLRKVVNKRFELSHDVLRHSAITYHVAKHKSLFDAAEVFGNSESVIRRHYKDNNRTEAEADEFFAIRPKAKTGELVKFAV